MYTHGTTSPFPSTSSVTIDDASHPAATLVQEIPADSGNFPWYMTDSVAVEVVVNVIDLALNWQLFSDVGRPRTVFLCKHELWKCPNCVHSTCVKSLGGGGL